MIYDSAITFVNAVLTFYACYQHFVQDPNGIIPVSAMIHVNMVLIFTCITLISVYTASLVVNEVNFLFRLLKG